MGNKKRNTIITIIILILILLGVGTYFLLKYGTKETGLSILEKKWITDQTNKMVDVNVYNDIPIYGYNGDGIIFDFLDFMSNEYKIGFNKISYYTDGEKLSSGMSFMVLPSNEQVKEYDILMNEDSYVIVSSQSKNTILLDELEKVAILKNDEVILKEYFGENIEFVVYEDADKLVEGIKNEECFYAVISGIGNMNKILENEYHVVYHIEDLKKKLVLRVEDATVYSIMQKCYNDYYEESYRDDYSKNYLNLYFNSTDTSDLDKKNYNAKAYRYGYVVNMPYENTVNGQFVGTISNYLSDFEEKADIEIEVVPYPSIDDLKSALVSGEIDFAFSNFDYTNFNMESVVTSAVKDMEYVVLSKNPYKINSVGGLKNISVSVVASSNLHKIIIEKGVDAKMYPNTDALLRSIDDSSVILLDKETYIYYQDNKLKDYNIILEDSIDDGYKFLLRKDNTTFNHLFDYYVSMMDYQSVRYLYNTDVTLDKDYTMIKVVAFIVSLVFFLIATVIFMNRKNVTNTVISKEEKLKYIDTMTSLKNRNYLNMNIYKWDDNVIFPQSVVVLDVNNLREVNDTFGRETGDEVIKKVASVLINNQLENTDIIRSGGDEFLIYMVGYEEKQVSEYMKKLVREMKSIPNCMGVEFGYSMILDEVKTVDDAINEAIIMMTKGKEKQKTKKG